MSIFLSATKSTWTRSTSSANYRGSRKTRSSSGPTPDTRPARAALSRRVTCRTRPPRLGLRARSLRPMSICCRTACRPGSRRTRRGLSTSRDQYDLRVRDHQWLPEIPEIREAPPRLLTKPVHENSNQSGDMTTRSVPVPRLRRLVAIRHRRPCGIHAGDPSWLRSDAAAERPAARPPLLPDRLGPGDPECGAGHSEELTG